MSKIKELAKEIRRNYAPAIEAAPVVYKPGGLLCQILDLIESAEEQQNDLKHGTILFFPDPQPTLKEAAQAVIDAFCGEVQPMGKEIDKLKAALEAAIEREDNDN